MVKARRLVKQRGYHERGDGLQGQAFGFHFLFDGRCQVRNGTRRSHWPWPWWPAHRSEGVSQGEEVGKSQEALTVSLGSAQVVRLWFAVPAHSCMRGPTGAGGCGGEEELSPPKWLGRAWIDLPSARCLERTRRCRDSTCPVAFFSHPPQPPPSQPVLSCPPLSALSLSLVLFSPCWRCDCDRERAHCIRDTPGQRCATIP
ncbi:uncharacterized protein B0I36DRAFT_160649 [Microdochium trichocladiopsis]|uniref:Uncharacterized protein n=1 Tax=Microdochium trichocladiopsis TaxID=1682393 RepID=A0A9P8Y0P2_9PEZI|nr:uncharacterized protein B0I36DRAFT_160649 [Microdochium trichocladiopsis]KAH7026612.1 hypothetical protein B0I36DRAFT_160649 [Microdochium trichocladiopsis]